MRSACGLASCPSSAAQSGWAFGSVPRLSTVPRNWGTDCLKKKLGTDSRLFWFGFGSNRINRIFSEDLKTIINILVLRQIFATLDLFLIIIIYKKTIAI